MMSLFLFASLFMSIVSFVNFDPIKSSFFLIFSLLASMPILSLLGLSWFSYFVCLLFLSGVFVILVYFSSLSKLVFISSNLLVVLIFLSFYYSFYSFGDHNFINLNVFYNIIYIPLLALILMILISFMNFSSYFLNFSGALRKF